MLGAALLLNVFISVLASEFPRYCETLSKGYETLFPQVNKYLVREHQKLAKAPLLPDPQCAFSDTGGVSVTACDFDRKPLVAYYFDRQAAVVGRVGSRAGAAQVNITVYCKVPLGAYNLPTKRHLSSYPN